MIYSSKILHLDDNIEEEAVLLIEGVSLTCFVNVCPYAIKEDQVYPVDLRLWSLEGLELTEALENEPCAISRIGTGFSHSLTGKLNKGRLEVGSLVFEEPEFSNEFQYLKGRG
jgi:hypothetical protein